MPRVLLILEYPSVSGAEMSMLATLGGLRAAGYEIVAAAPPTGRLSAALHQHDVTIRPFAAQDRAGKRLPLDRLRQRLADVVSAVNPDLVHANSLAMGRVSGPVQVVRAVPSVAHLRDIVRLSRQAIADLNCHNRLLAVSLATRDYHVAAGLSAERTAVVRNGVDLQAFRPRRPVGHLHQQLSLPAGVPLIGSIGQISLRKGIDVLVHAARQVLGQCRDAHFLIVGTRLSEKAESRQLERDLRRSAATGLLAGHVHFLGFRDDVADLLVELTLLVHPARQEPLGRVLLEAAAAGVAIVATDVGGTREIFPSRLRAACLVPPADPVQLAHEIVALLDAPAERDRMGAAARRRVVDAFPIGTAAAALAEQYRIVLRQTHDL